MNKDRTSIYDDSPYPFEPGKWTSEFWFNILILVGTFVLVIMDRVEADIWLMVSGLQGVGYAASRAYRKANG